jgi:hypothetical protein
LGGSGPIGPGGVAARQTAGRTDCNHIAAAIAKRKHDQRIRQGLEAIARGGGRKAAGRAAGHMETGLGGGISFETLIAGLPDGIRDRFIGEASTKSIIAQKRLNRGYRS